MKKILLVLWACGAAVCSGQFYFEAGPWVRGGMDLEVAGGSSAAAAGVQAASPGWRGGTAWVAPLPAGDDGTAQVLRTFDDGYVGPSGWAWANAAGISQYFGYDDPAQYNAAANTLTFASTAVATATERRTETRVASGAAGWSGEAELDGAGALATMGYVLTAHRLFEVGVQFQAGWLDGLDAAFCGQSAWTQEATWTTWESRMEREQSATFVYDTLGNPVFPAAPYAMTDPAGVGPLISDRPIAVVDGGQTTTTSDRIVGRRQARAQSRVDLEMDAALLSFTLGPRLRIHPTERLAILVQGGVTANLLDAELARTETFAWEDGTAIRSWSDSADEQKWLWGGTLSAGIQYGLTQHVYLHAAGGYDWVEDCELAVGPDRVRLDLDGYRAELALGWRFGGR